MPNEISEIARKWARWFLTGTFSEDERPLSFAIQSAIDEAMAQQIDPLPVMEKAADWIDGMVLKMEQQDMAPKSVELTFFAELLETIAQIRRERGLTEAAEHMRKLKEADNEPK